MDTLKINDCVERRIALVLKGTEAALWEFPKHFSDVTFPIRALSFAKIWP